MHHPGSHVPAGVPGHASPAAPPRAPSLLVTIVIALAWTAVGVVVSVLGVLFVGLALNGYSSVGSVTTALWLGVGPGLTTLGGVPVAIGYRLGARPLVCAGLAALAAALAAGAWVLIFVVAPA